MWIKWISLLLIFWSVATIAKLVDVGESLTDELIAKVEAKYKYGAGKRMTSWKKVLTDKSERTELDTLKKINRFVNQVRYVRDIQLWKKNDYWATPIEFLGKGGGDCEDFSITKYFSLLALGIPDEKLQLTYVKVLSFQSKVEQAHMVLTYYEKPDAVPFVLDNMNGELLRANERVDLRPVYSFNGRGLWAAKDKGRGKRIGDSDEVTRWRELTSRMFDQFEG